MASKLSNCILFGRFASIADRDAVVTAMRNAKATVGGKAIWAKPDLPLDVRTAQSVLFATKRLLVQWGFNKSALWVDTNLLTIYIGAEEILHAKVSNNELHIQYAEGWKEYLDSPEWKEMVQTHTDKFKRTGGTKGAAKGTEKAKGPKPGGPDHADGKGNRSGSWWR